MKNLIEVFRMEEISKVTRANLIVKLGEAINYQYASNVTEPVVYELVTLLYPEHEILKKKNFLVLAGQLPSSELEF
jgi:hypothetical protein